MAIFVSSVTVMFCRKVNNDLVSLDVLKLVNTKDGKTTQRGSGSKLPLFVVQAVTSSREKGQQKQPHG